MNDDDVHHALPPRCMQSDDPSEAEGARRRVRSPNKRFSWAHLRRRRDSNASSRQEITVTAPASAPASTTGLVDLPDSSGLPEDEGKDIYRWAILYENQRGITIFSTAYYSSLSLLPHDPPPFTVPEAQPGVRQPKVSLDEYPLPDGNWRWVSKSWMIDMRGDGAVQYDGFEYNWFFRRHHWRPNVGHLNAGGWVRRRRWVRLMVKPAKKQSVRIAEPPPANEDRVTLPGLGSTQPPSTIGTSSSLEEEVKAIGEVWRGDAAEDWDRCHALMKRVGRDGRRIELWKTWLGGLLSSTEDQALQHEPRPKQWTEDSRLMPSEADYATKQLQPCPPPLEVNRTAIANVIRTHGQEIIHSFIYPDSRAQFLDLLARSGLVSDITPTHSLDNGAIADMADFWSYTHRLTNDSKDNMA